MAGWQSLCARLDLVAAGPDADLQGAIHADGAAGIGQACIQLVNLH